MFVLQGSGEGLHTHAGVVSPIKNGPSLFKPDSMHDRIGGTRGALVHTSLNASTSVSLQFKRDFN